VRANGRIFAIFWDHSSRLQLEPMIPDTNTWFSELDRLNTEPLPNRGRKQPKTPRRKIFS
jgi:hypothetical protein